MAMGIPKPTLWPATQEERKWLKMALKRQRELRKQKAAELREQLVRNTCAFCGANLMGSDLVFHKCPERRRGA